MENFGRVRFTACSALNLQLLSLAQKKYQITVCRMKVASSLRTCTSGPPILALTPPSPSQWYVFLSLYFLLQPVRKQVQTLKFTILNLQYSHLRVFALAVSLQECACPRYYPLRFQSGLCSDILVLFLKGPCHHMLSL